MSGGGETRVAVAGLLRGALLRGALPGLPGGGDATTGPHLLVLGLDGTERPVALADGLTVGRGPEAALRLEDAGVSRLHARLRLLAGGVAAVEDLGSKNGLTVNGRRVGAGAVALGAGDVVRLGATTLRLVDPGGALPDDDECDEPGGPPEVAPQPIGASRGGRAHALGAAGLLLLAVAAALWDAAGAGR